MGGPSEPIRAATDIDAAWLTEALHAAGVGLGAEIVAVGSRSIGTGQVGENVRFDLAWSDGDAGDDADRPASVVGKFPSPSEVSRSTAVDIGTYQREVGFYRDLQQDVTIRTPQALHVGWEPATHDFVLLMEDVAPAEPGDQLGGCSVDEAVLAVDEAVGLHAPTWGRVEEYRRLGWLGFPGADRTAFLTAMLQGTYPGFAERFSGRLTSDDVDLGAALIERYGRLTDRIVEWAASHAAWCVTHGDYRLDNMLFGGGDGGHGGDSRVTIVDWQTVTVGTGPADVAYFCGAGLLPDQRAAAERDLVGRYAAGLRSAGVSIADDDVWEGYVLGSASGYLMAVLASQVVEQTERGDEMFAVMAERHAAQMCDLDLIDQL
ncbi:MAG: phosphotransferase [Ilumatobacter sp.]|uniref:phosphotransferase family protein n=1 Tax=Ilumatobacter sp. TaxID=1967498 RepID=UPI00262D758B|nr:phosphotransferase [Ilumatobacter sp.]MDJ0767767.1 phosphotransferase [Ilumatobacter sp.]